MFEGQRQKKVKKGTTYGGGGASARRKSLYIYGEERAPHHILSTGRATQKALYHVFIHHGGSQENIFAKFFLNTGVPGGAVTVGFRTKKIGKVSVLAESVVIVRNCSLDLLKIPSFVVNVLKSML